MFGVLSSGENLARGRRRSKIVCVCWVCDFSRLYLLVVGCGTETRELRRLGVSQGTKFIFRRRASFGLEGGSGRRNRSGGRGVAGGAGEIKSGFDQVSCVTGCGWCKGGRLGTDPTARGGPVSDGRVLGPTVRCSFGVYPRARVRAGSGGSGGRGGPLTPITAVNDSCLYMSLRLC